MKIKYINHRCPGAYETYLITARDGEIQEDGKLVVTYECTACDTTFEIVFATKIKLTKKSRH